MKTLLYFGMCLSFSVMASESSINLRLSGENLNLARSQNSYYSEKCFSENIKQSDIQWLNEGVMNLNLLKSSEDCTFELNSSFITFKLGELTGDMEIISSEDAPSNVNVSCFRPYADQDYLKCDLEKKLSARSSGIPNFSINLKAKNPTIHIKLVEPLRE